MKNLTKLEELVFNEGERLIPGKTHNDAELTRHLSSYNFFKEQILKDRGSASDALTIVDLGSGTGYGCKLLSEIPGSYIHGVDNSQECRVYARANYLDDRICYETKDLREFITGMSTYDYAVSRGVFEHIKDGLDWALQVKFKRLFMFDVPYDEAVNNPHHLLLGITESSFSKFSNAELYYQDLEGNITREKIGRPNMVGCICKKL